MYKSQKLHRMDKDMVNLLLHASFRALELSRFRTLGQVFCDLTEQKWLQKLESDLDEYCVMNMSDKVPFQSVNQFLYSNAQDFIYPIQIYWLKICEYEKLPHNKISAPRLEIFLWRKCFSVFFLKLVHCTIFSRSVYQVSHLMSKMFAEYDVQWVRTADTHWCWVAVVLWQLPIVSLILYLTCGGLSTFKVASKLCWNPVG